jgi:predicted transposase/invertase (TIGR01784 family)
MPKYINPYTDFGFKKLFGEEANKDLLIDFLNQMLPPVHQIQSLTFKNPEKLPDAAKERKAFFDIECQSVTGEAFIVEMQKAKVKFFKDRALFYTTFPIREQAKKGVDWNFELKPIYFIAILDFLYDESLEKAKFWRDVQLTDQDCEPFYNKLHFKFLQMPAFTKKADELVTKFDKWAFFLKNLETFQDIPAILKEPIFEKAFETSRLTNMSARQRTVYEKSQLDYLGVKAVSVTAWEEGKAEGMAIGEAIGKEEGIAIGEAIGKEEGIAIGKEEGIVIGKEEGIVIGEEKTVIKLHQKGKTPTEISSLLDIPLERVNTIIEAYEKSN